MRYDAKNGESRFFYAAEMIMRCSVFKNSGCVMLFSGEECLPTGKADERIEKNKNCR